MSSFKFSAATEACSEPGQTSKMGHFQIKTKTKEKNFFGCKSKIPFNRIFGKTPISKRRYSNLVYLKNSPDFNASFMVFVVIQTNICSKTFLEASIEG